MAMRHDLVSLRLFVAICESRNLSRAAEGQNIAVSAASRRLRQLEDEAGTLLVQRRPHGVEPTAAGATMLRYAQSVLRLSDELGQHLGDYRGGVRGRVRVVGSSSALVQRLAADLARFSCAHPEIMLDLEERPTLETIDAVQRGAADLGIVVAGSAHDGLVTYPYATDRLMVAVPASHPLAAAGRVTLDDLFEEDFVALEHGTATQRLVTARAREAGRYLKLRVQVRTFEVMCQMIRHGLGIGILPEEALRPLVAALGLTLLTLDEAWAFRRLEICVPAGRALAPPAARLLADLQAYSQIENPPLSEF